MPRSLVKDPLAAYQLKSRRPRFARAWRRGRMTTMAVIGITGATDGIGRATAQVLLAEGHRVLVHARRRERGEPILQALGGDGALLVGDLARLDDVHRLTKSASTARSTRG